MTWNPANPPAGDYARYLSDELNRVAVELARLESPTPGPGGDPRSAVAFITGPGVWAGFGIATVTGITNGLRVTWSDNAGSITGQQITALPDNASGADRYYVSCDVRSGLSTDFFFALEISGVMTPVGYSRLMVERTLL